jgi:hypothetical protein
MGGIHNDKNASFILMLLYSTSVVNDSASVVDSEYVNNFASASVFYAFNFPTKAHSPKFNTYT